MTEIGSLNFSTAVHRRRLLQGMTQCIANQGYAATTIADIASTSRVSKRTFYEHFRSKQDCLLALYVETADQALGALKEAIQAESDPDRSIEAGISAYFDFLATHPEHLRTLFIEVMSLGMDGLKARKSVHQELVDTLCGGIKNTSSSAPPYVMAGLMGVIVEFVLGSLEDNSVAELPALAAQASFVIRSILAATVTEAANA